MHNNDDDDDTDYDDDNEIFIVLYDTNNWNQSGDRIHEKINRPSNLRPTQPQTSKSRLSEFLRADMTNEQMLVLKTRGERDICLMQRHAWCSVSSVEFIQKRK